MDKDEEKLANRWKGFRKIGIGITGFIVPALGFSVAIAGGAAFLGGSILRGVGWLTGNEKYSNWGQNLQSMGIKTGVTGLALSNPFTTLGLMIEGIYNAYSGKQSNIGFERVSRIAARFVSGLPQFGDDDYVHNRTGWQHLPEQSMNRSQANQRQSSVEMDHDAVEMTEVKTRSPSVEMDHKAAEDKTKISGGHSGPDRHEDREPAEKSTSIDIKKIAESENFEKATEAYVEQVKISKAIKFEIHEMKEGDDGTTIVTYRPPGYTKENCPPDLLVNQIFNKDGDLIAVHAGQSASCVTAPVKTSTGFTVRSYDKGLAKDERASIEHAKAIQAEVQNSQHQPAVNTQNTFSRDKSRRRGSTLTLE